MSTFIVPLIVVVDAERKSDVDDDRIADLLMAHGPDVEAVHGMGVVEVVDDPEEFWDVVAQTLQERRSGS